MQRLARGLFLAAFVVAAIRWLMFAEPRRRRTVEADGKSARPGTDGEA